MKNFIQILKSAILAGFCIGIAGYGYLAEKSIIGAVLFAFGLLTVVHYKLKLYTGTGTACPYLPSSSEKDFAKRESLAMLAWEACTADSAATFNCKSLNAILYFLCDFAYVLCLKPVKEVFSL